MKLWEKKAVPDSRVIEFTSGKDRTTDMCLAEWDIAGSMAHAIMLCEAGLITETEKRSLLNALHSLFKRSKTGALTIGEGIEDIHSQIEKELVSILGDTGKKIHTGRSRNDQVLTDIRLYTRKEIDETAKAAGRLFYQLLSLSEQHRQVLIPGYTHMQPAMVSSFGLWFASYAESIADDILMLSDARSLNNRNPLGSGAGYGSTLPLNRMLTTGLLEFEDLLYNSAYAAVNRGKAEFAAASAIASLAQTLSRLAMDMCLFMTAEMRFVDFPDEFVTGSSIMPQKRNPDVFELIRGKANLIQTLPGQVSALVSGLPSGYNRELQLLKDIIFNGFTELKDCIGITIHMLNQIRINDNITANPLYNSIFSTEEVNRLVKQGIPFRDAYRIVGEKIGDTSFTPTSLSEYTHEGSIGNLCNAGIEKIFSSRIKGFMNRSAQDLIEKMISL